MRCILFLFLLINFSTVQAVIVGSNTAVSRQPLAIFPVADTNNEMRGFAAFEAGFTLQTAATRCLFNAAFPVGGTVTLNGGTLTLNLDLMFDNGTSLVNGGFIDAALRLIALPYTLGSFSLPNGIILDSALLQCNSDIVLTGPLRLNGVSVIDGNNNTMNMGNLGQLVVGSGGSLLLKNITVQGIRSGNLLCADNLGTITFENSTVIFDAAYSFTQGKFDIVGSCIFTGTQIFAYQSSEVSTVRQGSMLMFDSGMTFSYDPTIASRSLLSFVDNSSILYLYETTLFSTPTGLQLTKGTIRVDGNCPVLSQARVASEGLLLGDGSGANDVAIEIMPESGFDVISGFMIYNNFAG